MRSMKVVAWISAGNIYYQSIGVVTGESRFYDVILNLYGFYRCISFHRKLESARCLIHTRVNDYFLIPEKHISLFALETQNECLKGNHGFLKE